MLWMDEFLHHFETMKNCCPLVVRGESSFQGFLGGAGFRPSTVWPYASSGWPVRQAHLPSASVLSCRILRTEGILTMRKTRILRSVGRAVAKPSCGSWSCFPRQAHVTVQNKFCCFVFGPVHFLEGSCKKCQCFCMPIPLTMAVKMEN